MGKFESLRKERESKRNSKNIINYVVKKEEKNEREIYYIKLIGKKYKLRLLLLLSPLNEFVNCIVMIFLGNFEALYVCHWIR